MAIQREGVYSSSHDKGSPTDKIKSSMKAKYTLVAQIGAWNRTFMEVQKTKLTTLILLIRHGKMYSTIRN